jgi:cytochrome c
MMMRFLPVASLVGAALLTAACGGGDTKTAETPALKEPASPDATFTDVEPVPPPEEAKPLVPPTATAAMAPAAGASLASLTGDAAKGEKVFAQCKACHVVEPGVNRVGPSLHGVVGRTAGSIAGFNYSKANKESGVTWNAEVLFTYLEAPQKFMPGTRMAFGGLKNPQDRADVIAFLKTKA